MVPAVLRGPGAVSRAAHRRHPSLDSAPVSKAAKRERQRQNREVHRQYQETLSRRRRQRRLLRNLAVVAVPVVVALVLVYGLGGSDDPSDAAGPRRTYASAPAMQIDPAKTYVATMETSLGTIVMELDAKNAPTSVNDFVFLARRRFYDGLTIHRTVKDFVIQGGDPAGDGSGGPGYTVTAELPADGYAAGSVAWAKTGTEPAGSAGSQFFIVLTDQGATNLGGPPYQYGYLGKVTSGLDVARAIGGLAPASGDGPPTKKVTIERVRITESAPSTTTVTTTATTPAS
jgi:peptidyl-prolyl cis-trans isomerase B (cyclophilin B)